MLFYKRVNFIIFIICFILSLSYHYGYSVRKHGNASILLIILEFKVVWLVKQRKKDVKVVIKRQDTSCLVLSVATNKKEYSLTIMETVLLAIK